MLNLCIYINIYDNDIQINTYCTSFQNPSFSAIYFILTIRKYQKKAWQTTFQFHSFILRFRRTFMNPNKTKKISPGLAQRQRHKKDLRFMINVLNVLRISTDKHNPLYFFQIGFTKLSSFQNFIVLCILYHRVLDLNLTLRMSSFLCLRILFGFFLC